MDYMKLEADLKVAKAEALKYADYDDGGTCNFDSPMLRLDRVPLKRLEALFGAEYGVWKPYQGHYIIGHKLMCGQGNRRTKMAEVFADTLRSLGWDAYVHYVMD